VTDEVAAVDADEAMVRFEADIGVAAPVDVGGREGAREVMGTLEGRLEASTGEV